MSALVHSPAQVSRSDQEQGLNEVGLWPSGFGTFHLVSETVDERSAHRAVCQGTFFNQGTDVAMLKRTLNLPEEVGTNTVRTGVPD